jgi:hypothetical protein
LVWHRLLHCLPFPLSPLLHKLPLPLRPRYLLLLVIRP